MVVFSKEIFIYIYMYIYTYIYTRVYIYILYMSATYCQVMQHDTEVLYRCYTESVKKCNLFKKSLTRDCPGSQENKKFAESKPKGLYNSIESSKKKSERLDREAVDHKVIDTHALLRVFSDIFSAIF